MKRKLFLASAFLLAACASNSGPRAPTPSRMTNVITAEEIATTNVTNAAELVTRLRPQWLRTRGPVSLTTGGGGPRVYIDQSSAGGVSTLLDISVSIIREIRYLPGRDASVKYGLGHGNGVIMVLTIRR